MKQHRGKERDRKDLFRISSIESQKKSKHSLNILKQKLFFWKIRNIGRIKYVLRLTLIKIGLFDFVKKK